MIAVQFDRSALRFWLAITLCLAALVVMYRYVAPSPLFQFMLLGLVAWMVPIPHSGLRRGLRVVGTIVGLGAFALYVFLGVLLIMSGQ